MGHSVLVVPVPALEEFVRGRWQHYEPAWVSSDPGFTHAHVTALAPWREEPDAAALARVAGIAAACPAFDFTLAGVAAFPDGVIHVPPSPAAPFRALTAALADAFEDCPPYAGAFGSRDALVPHLTLDHAVAGVDAAAVAGRLGDRLPVSCRATHLEWQWYAEGDCHVRARWPLGGPTAGG